MEYTKNTEKYNIFFVFEKNFIFTLFLSKSLKIHGKNTKEKERLIYRDYDNVK
jgi:hypothetical protein